MALAVMVAVWSAAAQAQQAVELRPTLEFGASGLLDDEMAPADALATGTEVGLQPRRTQLTIAPEPPPEPPLPPRRLTEEDPYAPLGLRTGAFRLYPGIAIGGVYSDNVNDSPDSPEDDVGLRVAPDLRIESDWARHALSLTAAGDFIFFDRHPEYNDTDFDAAAALRLDVRHDTTLELAAAYGLTETFGSSSEVPETATSQRLDQTASVSASLTHRFSRLVTTLVGEASWQIYGDVEEAGGATENNSDRNYAQPGVRLRAGYEASPAIVPFVEAGYEPRLHEQKVDRSGLKRDSQGGFLRAGVALAASEVWSGEVALRYDYRNYDDPSLDTVSAVGLDASLLWRPNRLTTVSFSAATDIDETAVAGASGIRNWTGRASIAHALRDNLVVTAGLGADYDSYEGITRNELTLTADFAVSYLLRRNVELVAGYTLTDFESDEPGRDYVENRVSAGLRFKL